MHIVTVMLADGSDISFECEHMECKALRLKFTEAAPTETLDINGKKIRRDKIKIIKTGKAHPC